MTPAPQINVFYDEGCPICRWEVDLYSRMDREGNICWTEIGTLSDSDIPNGKTREALLGKFHVNEVNAADSWHIGVDAFARIWRVLPGLRHAAFVFRLPVIRQLAGVAYFGFLKWQSWHRAHRRDV